MAASEIHDRDMAALARIAREPARKFRSILRFLAKGYHLEQAWTLVGMRGAAGTEMLADDVNTLLSLCAFGNETYVIQHCLAEWKRDGTLASKTEDDVMTATETCLRNFDVGDAINIEEAEYKRSQKVHQDAKASKAHAGTKRPRSEIAGEPDDASTAVVEKPKKTDEEISAEWAAAGAIYKRYQDSLMKKFAMPEGQFRAGRLSRAKRVFEGFETVARLKPNARSYVLMLFAALTCDDVEYAKHVATEMLKSDAVTYDTLYMHMQPAFLSRLVEAGIIKDKPTLLTAEADTPKWCFLTAAAEAARGDQFGSKHGAVLLKDGKYLSKGHNHRFGMPGDPHYRVMHAEVHALVKLADPALALGSECYIIELDGHGVGYEEAVPCPMCQSGLCKLGVCKVHFSSHRGIITQPVSYRPHLDCQTYGFALKRIYPDPLVNPDA